MYNTLMRSAGYFISFISVLILLHAVWISWGRTGYYDTKYTNAISTTTPGATYSAKEYADLAQSALDDVNSLGIRAFIGAALGFIGIVVSMIDHRRRYIIEGASYTSQSAVIVNRPYTTRE